MLTNNRISRLLRGSHLSFLVLRGQAAGPEPGAEATGKVGPEQSRGGLPVTWRVLSQKQQQGSGRSLSKGIPGMEGQRVGAGLAAKEGLPVTVSAGSLSLCPLAPGGLSCTEDVVCSHDHVLQHSPSSLSHPATSRPLELDVEREEGEDRASPPAMPTQLIERNKALRVPACGNTASCLPWPQAVRPPGWDSGPRDHLEQREHKLAVFREEN